jgi:hypothetical protein
MFTKKISQNTELLDGAIRDATTDLDDHKSTSPEYGTVVDQLTKLYAIKEKNTPDALSSNTLITAGAHLAGILLIVGYEHKHVLTTSATKFMGKIL